ncbi:response regulator [Anaeromassilibacillus senegalensis]|uniref:response regulator n=1 Tax=Anaeromassilibacillus senegalensis TaxID=1673717 RepID=UPI000682EBF0|nr:response regulator [Anaeromassilibacillus senegalensis]
MKLLLVDDEVIAANALRQAFDWKNWGVGSVFVANSSKQAKQILQEECIDILLCDIEMPGESGLELVAWLQTDFPEIVCILLTCHADFSYAAQAIRNGVSDYLLKPVDFAELGRALQKAAAQIARQQEEREQQQGRQYWESNKNLVAERFWYDILSGAYQGIDYRFIEKDARLRAAEFDADALYTPVLLHAKAAGSAIVERNLFAYAFKNIAAELLLEGFPQIPIVSMDESSFAVLLPVCSPAEITSRCRRFAAACRAHLHAEVRYSQAGPCPVHALYTAVQMLAKEGHPHTEPQKKSPPSDSVVDRVKRSISQRLGEPLTREGLAGEVFLNPDYLGRLFKKETGTSINDYLVGARLQEAKRLLRQTEYSIGEIASRVGYSNFSYFSKLFKTETGYTPNEYRLHRQP